MFQSSQFKSIGKPTFSEHILLLLLCTSGIYVTIECIWILQEQHSMGETLLLLERVYIVWDVKAMQH